ncbi:MAG: T9SS type A sorting domain-containing protein [Flavobacteriales bacterium]|nr:T9SS type A sorting domain-containing protein [Flavobacteriales bacterium]
MKIVYITTILITASLLSIAQNFSYPTGQHLTEYIEAGNYESYEIQLNTPAPEAITYQYQLVSNTFHPNWSISLCDYTSCHVGIPSSGIMTPMTLPAAQSGAFGFFKMNITVGQNYGTGKVSYYVYDANDFARGDTVSWSLIWILAGDVDGNGILDAGEIAGDLNNNGVIDGTEVAGDFNGSGVINDGEIAGDINGSGNITTGELVGDVNGDGQISTGEVQGDTSGNGILDNGEVNGINEYLATSLKLYPNPAEDVIYIESNGVASISIYNILGKQVDAVTYQNGTTISYDASNLDKGLYLFSIEGTDGNVVTKKVTLK